MPLADKIIELRKKQGWSQIDLADRLDVSRQSVSKWEMAQAVPELDKIIKMSELFAVTTDYLLKDGAPRPEPMDVPAPAPETETAPGSAASEAPAHRGPSRKRTIAAVAACAAFILAASAFLLWLNRTPDGDWTVTEEPSLEQTAVFDPDAPEAGMTQYVYEGSACTAGGLDPEEWAAIAKEYAPFGVTCDADSGQWYFQGEPIRVFTDILTSNGESLTGGGFQGIMRNFAGEGTIDVRTVRDYDHRDDDGHGTLLYLESCNVRLDSANWTEHHAEEHHK